jgi:uncharacterized protein YgbK (DUF1537 family)
VASYGSTRPEDGHRPADHRVAERDVLAGVPPAPAVEASEVAAAAAASGRQIVILDDDPTGTQTVADVPVLTTWAVSDLRWAFSQRTSGFFVLTNSRSLPSRAAQARNNEVVASVVEAAAADGTGYIIASRSDSTLRGHFQLETDALAATIAEHSGTTVDGVIVVPAYIEGGRVTVDSVHWIRSSEGFLPVGRSEFARDATFGYRSSDLRDYVEEKSKGRWKASEVVRITLGDLRAGGLDAVAGILAGLSGGQPVVVDALSDEDLRVLSLAILRAEAAGQVFLYRVGPSFVRARLGQAAHPPLGPDDVNAIRAAGSTPPDTGAEAPGLVVVGSHVDLTTRQLNHLRASGGFTEVELDVARLLDPRARAETIDSAVIAAAEALAERDVIVSTSRRVVTGADADLSLAIARDVSAAVAEVVRAIVERRRPGWIVAKGGITSSDVATEGLGIGRAWVRGTLLPGIVSLWEPVVSFALGIPYVVFAGNVGDDSSLVSVVTVLRGGR